MNDKTIKKGFGFGLLLFWGMWFLIVAISNMCDFLLYHELLPAQVTFRSGHLILLRDVIKIHGLGMGSANGFLFVIALFQLLIADCYFIALFQWRGPQEKIKTWVSAAFSASIGLVMCFLLLSEVFVFYQYHSVFFTMMFTLLLSWHWLMSVLKL